MNAGIVRKLFRYNRRTGTFVWRVLKGRMLAGATAGTLGNCGIQVQVDGRFYKVHRLVWLYVHGHWPIGEVDHRNHNTTDNRLSNLRDVPKFVNMQNRSGAQRNSSTGVLGVVPRGSRFMARLHIAGKNLHLGTFDTALEAHSIYLKAKRERHEGNTL